MIDPNGIVLINKPAGMSSFGVVARVRRVLSQQVGKKVKVGHTGTLDPFATGLMILVVGTYCKRAGEFSKLDKTYEATMHLGATSSTGDIEGDLTESSDKKPTEIEIKTALKKFLGKIEQTPPIYSAIKIGGQRAYKLARKGEVVEMPKRIIEVKKLELLEYDYPKVKIVCDVSSGTYIRTLAEDIGKALGTGAYTTQLHRTRVGEFYIDKAEDLSENVNVQVI